MPFYEKDYKKSDTNPNRFIVNLTSLTAIMYAKQLEDVIIITQDLDNTHLVNLLHPEFLVKSIMYDSDEYYTWSNGTISNINLDDAADCIEDAIFEKIKEGKIIFMFKTLLDYFRYCNGDKDIIHWKIEDNL